MIIDKNKRIDIPRLILYKTVNNLHGHLNSVITMPADKELF